MWQVGLEHFAGDGDGYGGEDYDECDSEAGSTAGPPRSICSWLKGNLDPQMARNATGLWVNVFDSSSPHPGKVLLVVQRSQRELPPGAEGPREESGPGRGTLKVSSCQAYDYILLAALKSQVGWWQKGTAPTRPGCGCRQSWMLQRGAGRHSGKHHQHWVGCVMDREQFPAAACACQAGQSLLCWSAAFWSCIAPPLPLTFPSSWCCCVLPRTCVYAGLW